MLKIPYYSVKSVTSFAVKTCVNLKNVGWTILSLLVLFSKIRPKPILDSLSQLGEVSLFRCSKSCICTLGNDPHNGSL